MFLFFFFFSLFFSTFATFNELDYLKKGYKLRDSIISKLSNRGRLDFKVIKIIENNLLLLLPDQLEALMLFEKSILEVILHPTNYKEFIPCSLSSEDVKSKFWPKSFFSFKIDRIKITKRMQQKIFDLMSVGEITDYLMEDKEFINSNFNVSHVITKNKLIQRMISNRLGDIVCLPSKFFKALFDPMNEKLISSYQANCGLTLPEYVKSQLYPDDFFSFVDFGVEISNETRYRIFVLLDWKQIGKVLARYEHVSNSNLDIVVFINKNRAIIETLCDKVVKASKEKMIKVLTQIDHLKELPKYLNGKLYFYKELCLAIKTMIITQKLEKIIPHLGFNSLRPQSFFLLNIYGVEVSDEQRQRIFKLVSLEKIAKALSMDEDSLKSNCDIIHIVNKNEIVRRICIQVMCDEYSREGAIRILAEIDQLKKLPRYLENKYLENQKYLSYSELCEAIKVIVVIRKLKEIVQRLGFNSLCPKNFFLLNVPDIKISNSHRQRIFGLLKLDKIAEFLAKDKDSLESSYNIIQIINKNEFVRSLNSEVIRDRYCRDKTLEILAEIDQLKGLPKYLENKRFSGYNGLNGAIKMMIITQKLEKIIPHLGFDSLRPRNFFLLNIYGVDVSDKQRQRIFKLLDLEEIIQILAMDEDSLKSNCNICQIINKKEIVKRFCDWVMVQNYSRNEAIKILTEIERLNELPKYLENKILMDYGELCKLIQKKLVGSKFDKDNQNNQLLYEKNCSSSSSSSSTIEPQQENFKLLTLEEDIVQNDKDPKYQKREFNNCVCF